MSLSESKFRAIMSALKSDGIPGDEKRRAPRVGVGSRGVVLVHSTRRPVNVYIRDLSTGGVGLTCDQPMKVGEHLSLLLSRSDRKSSHVLYEVRHCRQAINGIFDVGARLVDAAKLAQPAPEAEASKPAAMPEPAAAAEPAATATPAAA